MKISSNISERRAPFRVLVPRIMDAKNVNAQNLNAKAMLARFDDPDFEWHAFHYGEPDPKVRANPRVVLHRFWRRHLWPLSIVAHYLRTYDAIFYPGNEWLDEAGLCWRRRLRAPIPIIATIEGIHGDLDREKFLSAQSGHDVYCDNKPVEQVRRFDFVRRHANHLIAISPFLSSVGRLLYGTETSVLPLGIEPRFFAEENNGPSARSLTVVGAGTVYPRKRPEIFFELAALFPQAEFVWYGVGLLRGPLLERLKQANLPNLHFPGAVSPEQLGRALRGASLFVLPSLSEGVPKVSQEAAASGLPVILFGHYEPSSVKNGETGYLVYSDDELKARVKELLENAEQRARMGKAGRDLSLEWNWDRLAPVWLEQIHKVLLAFGASTQRPSP